MSNHQYGQPEYNQRNRQPYRQPEYNPVYQRRYRVQPMYRNHRKSDNTMLYLGIIGLGAFAYTRI